MVNWNTKANHQIHGNTRKIPQEIFEKDEKVKLLPLPQEEFKLVKVGSRKIYHDCHIYVGYNYYSAPEIGVEPYREDSRQERHIRIK